MKTIDEDIRSGNLKQIYLLYGTEDYLKRQYRDKLKNALTAAGEDSGMGGMLSGGDGDMNFNRFEGKDINPKQVIDLAETLPFFAERRVILIENSGFFKGMPARSWRSICRRSRCIRHRFRVCGGGSGQALQDCTRQSRTPERSWRLRHPDGGTADALGAGAPEKRGKEYHGIGHAAFFEQDRNGYGQYRPRAGKADLLLPWTRDVIEADGRGGE